MQPDCWYGLQKVVPPATTAAVVLAAVARRWRWSDWLWDAEWNGLDKAAWLGLQILYVFLQLLCWASRASKQFAHMNSTGPSYSRPRGESRTRDSGSSLPPLDPRGINFPPFGSRGATFATTPVLL